MPFFLLFIALKLALVVFAVMLVAMFAAEFLPQMADWAVAASNGTMLAEVGQLLAKGLHFLAALAQKFLGFIYNVLASFGIDVTSLKEMTENIDLEAPPKPDKPDF